MAGTATNATIPPEGMQILIDDPLRERFLAALDALLANANPESVQSERHGDCVNRWVGVRGPDHLIDLSRADYLNGTRHGWFQVKRLPGDGMAWFTALEDGRIEYANSITDEIPDQAALVGEIEKLAGRVDADLRAASNPEEK
jgi:hypothetical protein